MRGKNIVVALFYKRVAPMGHIGFAAAIRPMFISAIQIPRSGNPFVEINKKIVLPRQWLPNWRRVAPRMRSKKLRLLCSKKGWPR